MFIIPDFQWDVDGNAPGISFMLHCGEIVSLLSSTKNASSETSKYRIQSQSLAGIYVIFRDFLDRIQRKQGRDKAELVVEPLGFDQEIALLNDYFVEIDAHATQRQRDAQIKVFINFSLSCTYYLCVIFLRTKFLIVPHS